MAKRKRPKPADPKPEPVEAAQVEEAPPPVVPPPVVEYSPPVASQGLIPCVAVRTPEDVIHNVIERQLRDEMADPPPPEEKDEALELWFKIQAARDAGQPLEPFTQEVARLTHGNDAEERLAQQLYRRIRIRRFFRQVESDEILDRFLHRCLRRGDLTPKEALVFKQTNLAELRKTLDEIIAGHEEPAAFVPDDLLKMDWSLQVTEKTIGKEVGKTTPQEREIIRKITIKARRKIFQANLPK